jgi:predicted acylesterase/phospholipase RssA
MSLSFPVLISTIPLWQIQHRQGRDPVLRRAVFSDGGISSNFPVQLFDAPLPKRPTFAIDLAGFERDEEQHLDVPADCVVKPPDANQTAFESWKSPESMPDFLIAIKDAMENWRDNSLARMPGFRERVVHIKLSSGEGGLNLAMDKKKVERLTARGDYAGQALVELFSGTEQEPAETAHWNDSRFARARTLLSVTARFLEAIRVGYTDPPDEVSIAYADRITAGTANPYRFFPPEELEAALQAINELNKVAQSGIQRLDDENVPHPRATIRIAPPI